MPGHLVATDDNRAIRSVVFAQSLRTKWMEVVKASENDLKRCGGSIGDSLIVRNSFDFAMIVC